jgi:hypothetical protein
MASTTLPNGIIVPEKFSRDWYADLYHNWQELDNLLGGGTPKDGTLTIQKNGTAVGTFSANQATDETINIEVPDVNNGTLTIQKNGDTVGTFTANQATDETINIEVPDVNNGTLTIQQNGTTVDTFTANSSSDKTVNIQCVDLTNNQTVGGIKTFSNAPVVGSINLDGKSIDTDANGNMTYDSHIVDTIEEQGGEYIRYSSGLQICWSYVSSGSQTTKNFPKSFSAPPSASVTVNSEEPSSRVAATCTLQAITVYNSVSYYGSFYIAIGRWK